MLQWIEIKHDQNRQHYFCFCLLSKICRCDDYDKVGQGNKGSCFKFFSWLCCGGDHILERTHWQIFQQYLCLALPGIFVQYLCSALGYLCNICARHLDICVIFVLGTGYLDILDISAIFVLGVEIFVQYLCLPVGCCCNPPSTTGTTLTSLSVYTNGATLQNKETQMGQHRKTKKHRCDNTAQTKIHRWCSNPAWNKVTKMEQNCQTNKKNVAKLPNKQIKMEQHCLHKETQMEQQLQNKETQL